MKRQLFSRPDLYIARTGDLRHSVVNVRIPDAPAFMRGVKAVFISDTHIIPETTDAHMQALIERIEALEPDILLMGGDYADMRPDGERFFKHLARISAPLGKYAVIGNNDPEDWPDVESLAKAAAVGGVVLLVNDAGKIPVNGGELIVAGVDEHLRGAPETKGLYPEKRDDNTYRVLLSHYPCMPEVQPDLMLSGHTHGGQFNCLGITPFTIGFERIMNRKISSIATAGLHPLGNGWLFVGKGIGASRLQIRIGVRPEIYNIRFDC